MNISPTNNSQPSFRGVIAPAVDIYKRPMSSIVFRVVPDTTLKGIQMGEKVIESENAKHLTKFLANPKELEVYSYWRMVRGNGRDSSPMPRMDIKTLINRVVNELGLSHHDRDDLFKFMKGKEMTVQKANEAGEFELRFEKPKQKPLVPPNDLRWNGLLKD